MHPGMKGGHPRIKGGHAGMKGGHLVMNTARAMDVAKEPFPYGTIFSRPARYHIQGTKFRVGDLVWFEVQVPNRGGSSPIQWGEARVHAVLPDDFYTLAGKSWDFDWVIHPSIAKMMMGARPSKELIQQWTVREANQCGDMRRARHVMCGMLDEVLHPQLSQVPGDALIHVWDRSTKPACPVATLEAGVSRSLDAARAQYGHDLGFAGAKQQGLGPEMCGITLEQLAGVRDLPGFNESMNMYNVVDSLIKPATQGKGLGYALDLNLQQPLRASYMVSHAWTENYNHFLKALVDSNLEGPFWVCAFAIYQCEDIPEVCIQRQIGADVSRGPFATVLKQCVAMVVVLTPAADIYTRMWCVLEIHMAVQVGVPVHLSALRETTRSHGIFASTVDAAIQQSESRCNSRLARCGDPAKPLNSDEKAIRALIERSPGSYDALDSAVEWAKATYLINKVEGEIDMCPALDAFQSEPAHPLFLGGKARYDLLAQTLSGIATVTSRISPRQHIPTPIPEESQVCAAQTFSGIATVTSRISPRQHIPTPIPEESQVCARCCFC